MYKRKKVVNSKKITIDGIQFQSRLEGEMYKRLKKAGIPHQYEKKSYIILDGFVYPSEVWERAQKRSKFMSDRRSVTSTKYTPDFADPKERWFIEVKGRANERFPLVFKLFKKLMSEREPPPMIFKPMSTKDCDEVIKILKENGY